MYCWPWIADPRDGHIVLTRGYNFMGVRYTLSYISPFTREANLLKGTLSGWGHAPGVEH